jgi:two-component system, sensor histidine kinase and response regulator
MSLPVQARRLTIVEQIREEPVQLERKLKVLVVDDSSYNIFIMEEILKLISTVGETVTALNGEEALALISGQRKYDIILMDIQMPILDGFQTV